MNSVHHVLFLEIADSTYNSHVWYLSLDECQNVHKICSQSEQYIYIHIYIYEGIMLSAVYVTFKPGNNKINKAQHK